MSEKILLIDGHSMLTRAFYGLPDLTTPEGRHTGAVLGFLNTMLKALEEENPSYLAVAFDEHAPTFRHEMYAQYKGTRKPMPEELREQVPLMKEVLEAMRVPIVTKAGYEADDILGTIGRHCEEKGMEVVILTGDRDLLQLATEHTSIRMPKIVKGQNTIEIYFAKDVLEKYQVTPAQFIDMKGLMGDPSDNIPGLPGVGEKTAAKILLAFGSIENAYEHVEEVKPAKARDALRDHIDLARLSQKLATINTASPVALNLEEAKRGDLGTEAALALCRDLGFKSLLAKLSQGKPAPKEEQGDWEVSFFTAEDAEGVRALFEKALTKPRVGASLLAERGIFYGAALALSGEEAYFLPAGQGMEEEIFSGLASLAEKTELCAMDAKALLSFAPIPPDTFLYDIGIGAYLLNPLKGSYPYEEISLAYLGKRQRGREELLGKKGLSYAEKEALPEAAVREALTALLAREPVWEELKKEGMEEIYRTIELPLIYTLHEMERWGIRCQGEELTRYGKELEERIGALEASIYERAGEEFNLNSPKQLGVILFEKLALPGGKKTKTGFSTAADVLEKLAPEQPIVRDILSYRTLAKLKSTYSDALGKEIGEDGKVHSTFNQTVTATGRISSQDPNLQNIPIRMEEGRLIRKAFVPEEGYCFLDADYSQIELRVLAHMSGDENLIEAYREAQDIHAMTASKVFHVPLSEVTPLLRRSAKAVNFGIVYGISAFGLSEDLSISKKEASQYIEQYFETYPGIKAFLDGQVEEGKAKGYVTTLYGRRRPVPELSSKNFQQKSFGERVAMNSPIQGTAADIIKIAMNRVRQRLAREGLASRLILQVHDELLIETRLDEVETVSRLLSEEMRGAADLSVELEVDMHQGSNWYEAK